MKLLTNNQVPDLLPIAPVKNTSPKGQNIDRFDCQC